MAGWGAIFVLKLNHFELSDLFVLNVGVNYTHKPF